jgi:ABC-type spermidine/putrescine transport system permease subunit II
MSTGFLVLAILSALWGVVDGILIAAALDRRGIRVNIFLFRVFFFRYLRQYREITLSETGKVGSLYYSFVVAMNVALVCGIVGWILRAR